ncbi:hypothetical protein [Gulosibacter molinativorax]|uniref:hypothetical protein n=1 Tax=Gulosibacter molinativorax TaxID=256821 RepID=UPI000D0BA5D5|nr:hypothetical protein [Gulosibacter molinativorax]QUY63967.1 Hypotetical protein [Gulosibacter molinativorax]
MTTERNIDDLLKEDEARLKAKRKRLSAFGKALDEVRSASARASKTAAELLDAGDLTRADLAKVFDLSKGERATLIPAAPKRAGAASAAQSPVQSAHAEYEPNHGSTHANQ